MFFVPEKLADGEPFERLLEFAFVGGDNASKRGCKLGPHRHFTFALVGKIEKLIDDFCAALFLVELGRFEDRAVPFYKAVAPGDFAPARKDVIAHGAAVGQEIAKTW